MDVHLEEVPEGSVVQTFIIEVDQTRLIHSSQILKANLASILERKLPTLRPVITLKGRERIMQWLAPVVALS